MLIWEKQILAIRKVSITPNVNSDYIKTTGMKALGTQEKE